MFFFIFPLVAAHVALHQAYVDGVPENGRESGIRVPPTNGPVKVLSSADTICNVNGDKPVERWIPVARGNVLSLQYWHNQRDDDILDKSHAAAILVYLAKADDNGKPGTFYKIYEDSYRDSKWATDRLIAAKGILNLEVPDVAPGRYVLRTEVPALHEAESDFAKTKNRGVQLYISCAQIQVTSDGKKLEDTDGIEFPDKKGNMQGYLWNMYSGDQSQYKTPGPAVTTKFRIRASYGKQ